MPKVTVIVPNYNHARFLPRRFESIFAQTCGDREVIALDDASTDGSREILRELAAKHPLQLIFNDRNSGIPFKQWNKGVAAARGEFIWIAESDDSAEPQLLERLVAALEANPKAGLAYCQTRRIDEHDVLAGTLGDWTADLDPVRWQNDFVASGPAECATALMIKNTIPNASAVVFRRSVFERAGGAPEDLRLCGDWMTWVRMLLISDVAFVAAPLNHFRSHPNSVRSSSQLTRLCAEEYRVKAYIIKHCAVPVEVRARAAADSLQRWHWCLGDPACDCGWGWQFRVAASAWRLGHPSMTAMFSTYLRYRLAPGWFGRAYRFLKRPFKSVRSSKNI
ncbi:MAG TPA: glycosyltransferase [Verrucomicrobiae bacterium]|nr:glycosyltransferase [Verrucomicrobiae bacterium]